MQFRMIYSFVNLELNFELFVMEWIQRTKDVSAGWSLGRIRSSIAVARVIISLDFEIIHSTIRMHLRVSQEINENFISLFVFIHLNSAVNEWVSDIKRNELFLKIALIVFLIFFLSFISLVFHCNCRFFFSSFLSSEEGNLFDRVRVICRYR